MNFTNVELVCTPVTVATTLRKVLYTAGALTAFAANSLICLAALGHAAIDPGGFTAIRLISGALMLWGLSFLFNPRQAPGRAGSWTSGAALFVYAAAFSFAYVSLSAGTGALILFGAVQVTMLLTGVARGERPHPIELGGVAVALAGLFYLVSPGLQAPPLVGALLMAVAGAAWGVYSLRGRGERYPVLLTAGNFLRSVPLAALLALLLLPRLRISPAGALLALISGALTSGLGYVIWYAALKCISTTRAAAVQLLVPILAAVGGVLLLGEQISLRLIVASVLVLGGIGAGVAARSK